MLEPNKSSGAVAGKARWGGSPAVIFANWREMLNQVRLGERVKAGYRQAIERYLES